MLPDEFIPVAEERGLIIPLGEWVLRAAATHLRRWLDGGLAPIIVAANVYGRAVPLTRFRIAPRPDSRGDGGAGGADRARGDRERPRARDVDAAAALLGRLRDRGVWIAIDDFGTGYSSLGYLRRFPLRRLKIDKGFSRPASGRDSVGRSDREDRDRDLAGTGVGESSQRKGARRSGSTGFLRFHGCDEAQGYFIERPVPEEAFLRFVAAEDVRPRPSSPRPDPADVSVPVPDRLSREAHGRAWRRAGPCPAPRRATMSPGCPRGAAPRPHRSQREKAG